MLSSSLDISEFINKVKGRSDQEIIYMADQEATAAERLYFKPGAGDQRVEARNYAILLKDVVLFMRHGILTHSARQFDLDQVKAAGKIC